MRIAVCLKQVPDSAVVSLDPETHTLVRGSVGAAVNPLDEFPLEIALRIKDATGAEVAALTMGPPRAEEVLARAVAMGADSGILLSDAAFAGGDTWATSLVLSRALQKTGPYDLILFGKQAVDGDTAQVGPETAAHMGLPQAAFVNHVKIPAVSRPSSIVVSRLFEDASDEVELPLPAVLTVLKEAAEPRFGSLAGRMRYFEKGVARLSAADLGLDSAKVGLKGSPTRVVKTSVPEIARARKNIPGSASEQASALAGILREKISAIR